MNSPAIGLCMRFAYLVAMVALNGFMLMAPWGSAYLSLIIALTYLCFRPTRVFHPNNMLFAFYGLYVILSSSLTLILHLIDWEYVLPWGQQVFWETFSRYTLFQAEFTFLVLFFSFRHFCAGRAAAGDPHQDVVIIRPSLLAALYAFTYFLAIWFIEATAGLQAWITDYSATYLSMREGHGLLNVVTIAFGNITVFLLGLKAYYEKSKMRTVLLALLIALPLSFIAGVKSRFIFLLILFLSPWFMSLQFRLRHLVRFSLAFFALLYVGTLVRTEGFYASWPFFLEMLVGYFNSFQLHDYILTSRDPGFLQTVFQIFVKPMQILGWLNDPDADFDISVMLTKEFFPNQWYDEHATQQWPLDTELYLNYYGLWLSWLPLIGYAWFVALLYRHAVLLRNYTLVPVFVMEFQRIFSTMRGTLIPWEVFIYIGQYLVIYFFCRLAISEAPTTAKGEHAYRQPV
jgi:hypothetical protein